MRGRREAEEASSCSAALCCQRQSPFPFGLWGSATDALSQTGSLTSVFPLSVCVSPKLTVTQLQTRSQSQILFKLYISGKARGPVELPERPLAPGRGAHVCFEPAHGRTTPWSNDSGPDCRMDWDMQRVNRVPQRMNPSDLLLHIIHSCPPEDEVSLRDLPQPLHCPSKESGYITLWRSAQWILISHSCTLCLLGYVVVLTCWRWRICKNIC